ncbi:MAG: HRDC domain-containing protein [Thermoanaerobaculaceae bacterium]|jgi:ribonuclease D
MEPPAFRPTFVADEDGVRRACLRAAAARAVALDTESDSLHSYYHKLCLIQLSVDGEHWVLDPLALGRDGLRPLLEILEDRGVEKILHGADYDLRVMNRDLGARPVNIADTQLAAQLLGEGQTGLAALVEREAGVALDKKYQRADWGLRPLGPELLAYAAGDTAFLGLLRDRLAGKLAELGRLTWWREECRALEEVRWEAPELDPLAFERVKGSGRLAGEARDRLAALYAWREQIAAGQDVPPFKVLRAEALLALAQSPPSDIEALAATPGVGRGNVRRFGQDILRTLGHPSEAPPRRPRRRFEVDREREARLRQARDVRDLLAKELKLDPGVLASRAALEQVVDREPVDLAEIRACLGREWKSEALAPALLPLVAAWRNPVVPSDAQPA